MRVRGLILKIFFCGWEKFKTKKMIKHYTIYEVLTGIALNASGIKEARYQTKQRTMINHNTTYEAGTPELASGFLLMPCYVSALASVRGVVLKFIFLFFVGGFYFFS